MANIVQLKRSSVSGRIPDAANIAVGEPVVNLADQILYTKDGSGVVKIIGAGTTSNVTEGVNLYFTNARAVSAFTAGDNITIDANGLITAAVLEGGGGGGGASVTVSSTEPVSPSTGNLWLDSDDGTIYIYSNSVWQEFARTLKGYAQAGYFANNYTQLSLQYGIEDLANVNAYSPSKGDILVYDGDSWEKSSTAKYVTLSPSTSAPTGVSAGTFATADGVSWDPDSKGGATPYPVFYNGTSWVALY